MTDSGEIARRHLPVACEECRADVALGPPEYSVGEQPTSGWR